MEDCYIDCFKNIKQIVNKLHEFWNILIIWIKILKKLEKQEERKHL